MWLREFYMQNKNKKPYKLSEFHKQRMETISQFVARHTYDKFIEN
jgi:hypothetical protein